MAEVQADAERIKLLEKTIEEINKEKQQIIGIVSHDIKAPLNRIFALVQLLHMDELNLTADQQQYLDKIHQVVADGLGMIRNLVDYRDLEYRAIETHPEEIDVTGLVITATRNYESLGEKKNISVTVHADENVSLTTDRQCLTRVLDALLSNAIKFSKEGKHVWVCLKNAGDRVEITVKDEARGFTSDDRQRLFHKFQKLSAKPTSGESSTGLGLFIAKKMLDTIHGQIHCDTQEGIGSTFIITLPKAKPNFKH